MWTQIAPFVEAETAYRRERIIATFPHRQGRSAHPFAWAQLHWRRGQAAGADVRSFPPAAPGAGRTDAGRPGATRAA
jgi:hypothetical protein